VRRCDVLTASIPTTGSFLRGFIFLFSTCRRANSRDDSLAVDGKLLIQIAEGHDRQDIEFMCKSCPPCLPHLILCTHAHTPRNNAALEDRPFLPRTPPSSIIQTVSHCRGERICWRRCSGVRQASDRLTELLTSLKCGGCTRFPVCSDMYVSRTGSSTIMRCN
jgi:hypothetical protein